MNVYGELTRAQLENLTADPSLATATEGRIWMRTDVSPVAVKVDLGGSVDTFCLLAATQTLTNKTISGATGITSVGTIATGVWQGTTVAAGFGGTGVTSVTTAPAATAFAGWDANKNLSANNFLPGYRTTATSGGTTTLVVGDTRLQYFTGSTTHTVVLPVTSTLALGFPFIIFNNSTGVVTVQSSGGGGNTIKAMAANTVLMLNCILTSGTGTASWNSVYAGATGSILTSPTVTNLNSTGTQTGWLFTVTAWVGTIAVGDTYTNNSNTYTVQGAQTNGTGQTLFMSGTGATSGGTLTKATSASGPGTITFSAKVATATYTPPSCQYIRIKGSAGGGGGGAAVTNNGSSGTTTAFGANIILAQGGGGGQAGNNGAGGNGTCSIASPAIGDAIPGNPGGCGIGGTASIPSGFGGASPFYGGAGTCNSGGVNGGTAVTNSGAGGGGGCAGAGATGGGGGSGGCFDAIIPAPTGTYPYCIGTGGALGAAGSQAGGAGADGRITVWEYYQ